MPGPVTQHPITPAQVDIGLDGLNDVDTTSPAPVNGDVLTFNGSGSTWRPLAPVGASAPATQVVIGTGSGVTSSAELTYTAATNTVVVGDATGGTVASAAGGVLTLVGTNTGLNLKVGANDRLTLDTVGTFIVNGQSGSSGQVLTSNGPGTAAAWTTPSGGGAADPTYVFEVQNITGGTAGDFAGALFNTWGSVTTIGEPDAPPISWDSYAGGFKFTGGTPTYFEILVECEIKGDNGSGYWPDGLSGYGIDLEAVYPALNKTPQTKSHVRYAGAGVFNGGNQELALQGGAAANLGASTSSFTERFIVAFDTNGVVVPRLFASCYSNTSPTASGRVVISFRRISDYSPA